jgi:transcriptional regulator with XRE-family HTH domain
MKKAYQEIGARIRALRLASKLTQAEVAERCGIDPSFYGQIERGANVPSLRTLFAVAEVLRVEPADLLPKIGRGSANVAATDALGAVLSRLKPAKRRFVMDMVRDLASEFDA